MTDVKIKCDDCKFVEDCVDYGWEGCKKFTPTQKKRHTQETTELKPCPFCGNEPTIVVRKGKDGWRDRYSVLCDYEHGGCGAESGWYHYEAEAVESWNKRVVQNDRT